jgi:CRISPR-associated protein Csb2
VTVTLAIRFPLGRYHATPWDRSVNEGAVEWPPSPWRLLRSLVSTWYTRWPELPAPVLDGILEALGDPPAYRTPAADPGHTRHYLPDPSHATGETGNTDLTLDPFLWVPQDEPLLVRWDVDLTSEQRDVLGKLTELLPYIGRADSVCEVRLLSPGEAGEPPDEAWWRPSSEGAEAVRLLAPTRPVRRAALELGTVDMRKRRRTLPPETTWVTYRRNRPERTDPVHAGSRVTDVDAVRFAVVSRAPLTAGNGILLADEVHRLVTRALDGGRREVLGHGGAATDHRHAHWVPLARGPEIAARVDSLLIWVPARLTQSEIAKILEPRLLFDISGARTGGGNYEVKGLPRLDLLLQGAGPVRTVAPELYGPARRWRGLTPYLPVRHRKPRRESVEEFLAADVSTELGYRGKPDAAVSVERDLSEGWARGYRRYRLREPLNKARQGIGLRLEFEAKVSGPLLLGQLSHFGYGVFVPDDDEVSRPPS